MLTFARACRVATTNAPPEDEEGNVLVYKSGFERLQAQADGEIGVFKEFGLGDLVDQGRASHGVLVSRLNSMFINHLKTTWVPGTLEKLNVEKDKYEFENALLGMPPAHEPQLVPHVKGVIVNAVIKDLGQGVSRLLQEYSRFHRPLKGQIVGMLRQEIKDAFSKCSTTGNRVFPAITDSRVLGYEHSSRVVEFLKKEEHPAQSVEFKLLYRASRDGWAASNFHSKCDNQGATITFIKCKDGNVFGGYAEASWTSSQGYVRCPKAFLFSLRRPGGEDVPVKLPVTDPEHAMNCSSAFGPSFGAGDIVVQNNANATASNQINITSYTLLQDKSRHFLAGEGFQALEVEVYAVSS